MLQSIPPIVVYGLVLVVVGIESLGIPVPGHTLLVGAALLASRPEVDVSPIAVGVTAATGAIVGGTVAYWVGHRFGMPLFERLGNRFPKHFGPGHVALVKRVYERWGGATVFFGRFVPVLRILASPLAGALKMRYARFVAANSGGALFWAGGTTAAVYYTGLAAERWMSGFGWIALGVLVVGGVAITVLVRERINRVICRLGAEHDWESLRRQ